MNALMLMALGCSGTPTADFVPDGSVVLAYQSRMQGKIEPCG